MTVLRALWNEGVLVKIEVSPIWCTVVYIRHRPWQRLATTVGQGKLGGKPILTTVTAEP